ncbi:MAG: PD-(D/E)XK nuclease family protein [Deltaproteobacteria bacterium]|jgi:hypothetical protein|nr:PD-(D/E)XK nuclease family protein [Deltaproteobacteria bacterium]
MPNDPAEPELLLSLRSFCHRYGAINEIAQRAQREIDRYAATGFSVFNLFKYDEMTLSKIIAELLSPVGAHGQGTLFLELFIRRANDILLPENQLDTAPLEKANVWTEVLTSHIERSQRRLDILVSNPPHWVLGIENKPWAWEQDKQLEDYQEELDRRYGEQTQRRYIVFISGYCSKPVTAAKGRKPLYFGYSLNEQRCGNDHAHLVDWLAECAEKCQADMVRHFLLDFARWARGEFVNQVNSLQPDGETTGEGHELNGD